MLCVQMWSTSNTLQFESFVFTWRPMKVFFVLTNVPKCLAASLSSMVSLGFFFFFFLVRAQATKWDLKFESASGLRDQHFFRAGGYSEQFDLISLKLSDVPSQGK